MDLAQFRRRVGDEGFAIVQGVVPAPLLAALRDDLAVHVERCRDIRAANGLGSDATGAAHHVLGSGDSMDRFLAANFLDDAIGDYFGGEYILNSFGAVDNLPDADGGYAHGARFHRDVRTWSADLRLMLNMLVMLDDFTVENGATKLVPGSHRVEARPSDDELEARAVRATGAAGDILLFDSNVWHSAAPNRTPGRRRALTLTFTRPFVKQQLDYPRLLGEDFTRSPRLRQVLGYNARVPANLDEWYQPPEKRMYRPGQG